MSLTVRFKPTATADIDSQAQYLAENASSAVAKAFINAVRESVDLLATHPELGERLAPESKYSMEFRRWQVRGFLEHLIFYRCAGSVLEVARVLHAKRDTAELTF